MNDVTETPKLALRNLSVIAYANGFTHWHYKDNPQVARVPGFFNEAADMLAAGDMISISNSSGGRNVFVTVLGNRIVVE